MTWWCAVLALWFSGCACCRGYPARARIDGRIIKFSPPPPPLTAGSPTLDQTAESMQGRTGASAAVRMAASMEEWTVGPTEELAARVRGRLKTAPMEPRMAFRNRRSWALALMELIIAG